MAIGSAGCGGSSDLKSVPSFAVSRVGHCSADPCVLFRLGDGASGANFVVTSHALKKSETVKQLTTQPNQTKPTQHNTTQHNTTNNTTQKNTTTQNNPTQHNTTQHKHKTKQLNNHFGSRTIPIPVEFDRITDVEMRTSSKRGILDVDSEPSWLPALFDRMDQRLDARLDTRFGGFERRIEQVLGIHQTRCKIVRQLLEDLRSEVGLLRKSSVDQSKQSCDMSSDLTPCPQMVPSQLVLSHRRNGVQKQCWYVAGLRLARQRRKKKVEQSTRKSRTNCSLVCRSVYKTMSWSGRRLLQTARFLSGSMMVVAGNRVVRYKRR